MSKLTALFVISAVLATTLVPADATHHRSLYEHDVGQGFTGEPDFESAQLFARYGGPQVDQAVIDLDMDGHGDVSAARDQLGDGGLFLDARMSHAPLAPARAYAFETDFYAKVILGLDGDRMIPGYSLLYAWFGWFTDKNGDGRIDDDCPARPGYSAAVDEFVWAGHANGAPHRLVAWILPGNHTAIFVPDPFGSSGGGTVPDSLPLFGFPRSLSPDFILDDRSANQYGSYPESCPSNTFQVAGSGFPSMYYDSTLLAEYEVVVAAFAIEGVTVVGSDPWSPTGYDFEEARFIDVDRYQALNPALAELWDGLRDEGRSAYFAGQSFSADTLRAVDAEASRIAREVDDARNDATAAVSGNVSAAIALVENATGLEAPDTGDVIGEPNDLILAIVDVAVRGFDRTSNASRRLHAADPMEPNTPFDNFPGALFRGKASELGERCFDSPAYVPSGACNDYDFDPLYAPDADCADDGVNATLKKCRNDGGYRTNRHAWLDTWARPTVAYPHLHHLGGNYGTLATVDVDPLVFDNPHAYQHRSFAPGAPHQFFATIGSWHDSNANTLIDPGTGPSAEFKGACVDDYDGTGGLLSLTLESLAPDGAWPGGLLVLRDFERTGKASSEGRQATEFYLTGPVHLRTGCEPYGRDVGAASSRDGVMFIYGALGSYQVRVTLEARVSFSLEDKTVVEETVTDIDIWDYQRIDSESV